MMSSGGDRHADAVAFLTRWSSQHADPDRALVWVQNPLSIPGSESAPQAVLSPAQLFLPD
jgi:hypothetical protein